MQYNNMTPISINDGKRALLMIPPTLPRKVEAAMNFIHLLGDHNSGASMVAEFASHPKRRSMSHGEERAYEAALAVVNHYFTGEMNFDERATVVELTNKPEVEE